MNAPERLSRDDAAGYRYLFGPVPSRRLGRSLGIDLLPLKTCSFNCLFCQLGRTEATSVARREYVSVDDVLREFDQWLAADGNADAVTLSGSGEPTLHTGFGTVLAGIAARCDLRRVLLTNSSLMHLPEVRAGAHHASVVKASLSACDQSSLVRMNRPADAVRFDELVEGLVQLRLMFAGELWIEVFFIAGVNDGDDEAARIAEYVTRIDPDRVHLNTVVRPPAEPSAGRVSAERLEALAGLFGPRAEVIADFSAAAGSPFVVDSAAILAMLGRRPCTVRDIAESFGLRVDEVAKVVGKLLHGGEVQAVDRGEDVYYTRVDHA